MVAAGIAVERQFNDLQKILVSKGEMIQVFSNVIANAIDAMPRGGTLSVSARKLLSASNDGVQVVLRDTGVGISNEHLARVSSRSSRRKRILALGLDCGWQNNWSSGAVDKSPLLATHLLQPLARSGHDLHSFCPTC